MPILRAPARLDRLLSERTRITVEDLPYSSASLPMKPLVLFYVQKLPSSGAVRSERWWTSGNVESRALWDAVMDLAY